MSSGPEPSEAFKQGIRIRREVLGDAYVDKALAGVSDDPLVASADSFAIPSRDTAEWTHTWQGSDPFARPGQEYVTEVCWASWGRPGLERKQRSLLNIGILMALNRGPELTAHIRGAINNGLTEEEISEAIRHTMIYAGVPSGVDAFKIAGKVIGEMKASGEYKPPAQ
jgi:4-carboxymuconolactone decarboxylase